MGDGQVTIDIDDLERLLAFAFAPKAPGSVTADQETFEASARLYRSVGGRTSNVREIRATLASRSREHATSPETRQQVAGEIKEQLLEQAVECVSASLSVEGHPWYNWDGARRWLIQHASLKRFARPATTGYGERMEHPATFRVREDVTAIQLTDHNRENVAAWCHGTVDTCRAPIVRLAFGGVATRGDWIVRDPKRFSRVAHEPAKFFVMVDEHFQERYTPGPAETI